MIWEEKRSLNVFVFQGKELFLQRCMRSRMYRAFLPLKISNKENLILLLIHRAWTLYLTAPFISFRHLPFLAFRRSSLLHSTIRTEALPPSNCFSGRSPVSSQNGISTFQPRGTEEGTLCHCCSLQDQARSSKGIHSFGKILHASSPVLAESVSVLQLRISLTEVTGSPRQSWSSQASKQSVTSISSYRSSAMLHSLRLPCATSHTGARIHGLLLLGVLTCIINEKWWDCFPLPRGEYFKTEIFEAWNWNCGIVEVCGYAGDLHKKWDTQRAIATIIRQ